MDRVRGPSETPQAKLRDSVSLDTSAAARARHSEQTVCIVEFDANLQVLLDYVLDRDRRFDHCPREWAYSAKSACASFSINSSDT